ncbi:DUF2306 domain-containing protein [uncultured Roseibium sp.]|uniref:DUF2306 domain-containing protein n=1 Tax=uncultured Roseibium sp. TaxID=1936171 RepID=UPI0026111397|nr:DUF2306 domain-containing protein [uncultured Roseibium sp.]
MERISRLAGSSGFWLATITSVLVAVVSYRFIPLGVQQGMEFVAHNLSGNALALYAHIGVAPIALALMPFQFMSGVRRRWPALHRWSGRVYVAAILVSGLAGLQLAFHTTTGAFATLGFALLAFIWLGTTGAAFYYAVSRQIERHRRWMLRSAALTFAAVTLRVYLGSSMALGADFAIAYPIISWACWVPNAVLVELYLRRVHSLKL